MDYKKIDLTYTTGSSTFYKHNDCYLVSVSDGGNVEIVTKEKEHLLYTGGVGIIKYHDELKVNKINLSYEE